MSSRELECGCAVCGGLAAGCKHCIRGSAMVLFVTGRCNTGCFFCPVSSEKMGKDVMYANEGCVTTDDEIIAEAEAMDATATGITGGDPSGDMDRTLHMIRLLKGHFGKKHHIHMYTSIIDPDKAEALEKAGLDEIRYHPRESLWCSMDSTFLKKIIDSSKMDIGIELPVLPDYSDSLAHIIEWACSNGIDFINLNELEFSESNWNMMESHGYKPKDDISSAVKGSEELAIALMKKYPDAPIHFCSSSFKDGVQLRRRLIRRAENSAEEYCVITEDGTVIKGIVYTDDLMAVAEFMKSEYDVPDILMKADADRGVLEIAPWILEEIGKNLPYKCYIVEEYPTEDRLEVERTPVNRGPFRRPISLR